MSVPDLGLARILAAYLDNEEVDKLMKRFKTPWNMEFVRCPICVAVKRKSGGGIGYCFACPIYLHNGYNCHSLIFGKMSFGDIMQMICEITTGEKLELELGLAFAEIQGFVRTIKEYKTEKGD